MNQAAMMKLRKMQKEMMDAQKRIENSEFVGTAGGIVSVTMTGSHEIKKVSIDKDAFESKDDIEMIEDSIVAAYNDCIKQLEKKTEQEMGPYAAMTGGLGGLF